MPSIWISNNHLRVECLIKLSKNTVTILCAWKEFSDLNSSYVRHFFTFMGSNQAVISLGGEDAMVLPQWLWLAIKLWLLRWSAILFPFTTSYGVYQSPGNCRHISKNYRSVSCYWKTENKTRHCSTFFKIRLRLFLQGIYPILAERKHPKKNSFFTGPLLIMGLLGTFLTVS